ncbi:LITAF-like zinc ribbon domain-containing protein [Dimargaris cristalligena]|uniref:LITAF-like zinc ribbon domain-containing protein n=1 Tax=Dimargaris cristalligena TaxID=215637 RepID=A0A4P9ZW92_9FUNG|nr:LITAF-like zinc ribbon domain-containing protein [Dimargaris cristalligena]|eukprot:RKP37873.1 LITAF-like zinc ribbon domain-containing protein [Dimargaris cristalligena]
MDQPPPYSVPELSEAVTKDAQALAPPPVQATPHNLTIRNRPIIATCPKCQTTVTSTIVPKVGTKAGIFALLTCLICWPLVWLPLCMDSCQDEVHQCPNCKTELGRIPA